MPLDGFQILDWASRTFGGLPAGTIGGLGVLSLGVAVVLFVSGFRVVPMSYGLLGAGAGMAVLTYFIVGAAIAASSPDLAGTAQVASNAPRVVPVAASAVAFGLGMFGLRIALRMWSSEESSGKAMGVLATLASVAVVFVGVQVVRGGGGSATVTDVQEQTQAAPPVEEPLHRGITRSHGR